MTRKTAFAIIVAMQALLDQFIRLVPGWPILMLVVGFPSLPLVGFSLGTIIRWRFSHRGIAICLSYYLLTVMAMFAVAMGPYAGIPFLVLLASGPILGLLLLIFSFDRRAVPAESRRLAMVPGSNQRS